MRGCSLGCRRPAQSGAPAVFETGSGAVVARKAHNLEVAGSIPASPTPRSLRMVASPRGEPLGRTPRLARWPAARVSSLDDSVAKLVDALPSARQAMVVRGGRSAPQCSSADRVLPGWHQVGSIPTEIAGPSPAGVIEFSSLLALPFYPLAGDSSVGPFSVRTRRPGRQLVAWHGGRGTGRA